MSTYLSKVFFFKERLDMVQKRKEFIWELTSFNEFFFLHIT